MLISRIYFTVPLKNYLSKKKNLFLSLHHAPGARGKEREKIKKHGLNPATIEICHLNM